MRALRNVAEWAHFALRRYGGRITFGMVRRYPRTPDKTHGTERKLTPIFDFYGYQGYWRCVIPPEIRQERLRKGIMTLAASMGANPCERKERGDETVWGEEEKAKSTYPIGPSLSALGRRMSLSHKPADKERKILCCNLIAHSGCSKGEMRPFPMFKGPDLSVCIGLRNMN